MKSRFIKVAVCALLMAIVSVSCSTVAFTGRNRLLMFSDSQITSLSNQSYAELMTTAKKSLNTANTEMVRNVGMRLTSALQKYCVATGQTSAIQGLSWDYQLVQGKDVNAFCMPNGKIVFYDGMMQYANTPDLVAVVMGHEIAHAIARHGNERMSQQAVVNMAGSVASQIIGAKTSANARQLFDTAFGIGSEYGIMLPFSRKHELEADEIGLIIMAIAGYDVDQAPVLWERMSAGSSSTVPEVLSTHPSNATRIHKIKEFLPKAKGYVGKY